MLNLHVWFYDCLTNSFFRLLQDMANLSATSTISVCFDILMVIIVAVSSPIRETIESNGGIVNVMKSSTIHVQTFFIGLGVLSFAFVCQDASFIIAGSLKQPTKKRWSIVTRSSLSICTMLAIVIGVTGYLGFLGETKGNVLQNFLELPKSDDRLVFGTFHTYQAINMARMLLGLTMFCVYPLASYVARHVLIVLFFSGKTAHSGDDHFVLARWDRRFILTFFLYIVALFLALLCDDLGTVLALTGAIAGSSISYLGPGISYLGVHGLSFLDRVESIFAMNRGSTCILLNHPNNLLPASIDKPSKEAGLFQSMILVLAWYILLMPLWCSIAFHGGMNFDKFQKLQAIRIGFQPNRLGKIIHKQKNQTQENKSLRAMEAGPLLSKKSGSYGSFSKEKTESQNNYEDGEEDYQDVEPPKLGDFFLAIMYIIVGVVALTAGIFSITS